MKHINFKALVPHVIVIAVFALLAAFYFAPEFSGKKLQQSDIVQFKGMSKEIVDFREATGEEALWTNSMFGGMPAYQISVRHPSPLLTPLDQALRLGTKGGFGMFFLYMIGFYILMLSLKLDYKLAALGAIAYALSSYFLIIIEVGHNSKALALGYAPAVLAGFIMLFQNRQYLWGTVVTALFLGLQVKVNHPQITYYMLMAMICIGLFYLIDAVRKGELGHLGKALGLFALGSLIGIGMSASRLMTTLEYSSATTRGPSELTPLDGSKKSDGLDIDYATAWSYGVGESWSLLVPNAKGGGSGAIGDIDELEAASNANRRALAGGADRYWGDQPFTSGPVYIGAAIFLLAFIGAWYSPGPLKHGLILATILALMLSWGKNFLPLTEFFLDYVPGYNKFRAVSMILVVVEVTMPLLAMLGLHALIQRREEIKEQMTPLLAIGAGVAGLLLLMRIAPGIFTDFYKAGELETLGAQLTQAGYTGGRGQAFLDDLGAVREAIFHADVMRSLLIVVLAFAVIYTMVKGILKPAIAIGILAVVTIGDLWSVDQRYLNADSYVSARKMEKPYSATGADNQILADKDPYYRVYNTTRRLDQDGATSYFHKSLGGYHGAKLGRYQELIDRQLNRNNRRVIDMLNAKYIIQQTQEGQLRATRNPDALGNAWFVSSLLRAADADAEMAALDNLDTEIEAVMDERFSSTITGESWTVSDGAEIRLTSYAPNKLVFSSNNTNDGLAVFSDIYYQPGWNATIDGSPVEHVRVNYVLRGMEIPAGEHEIVFAFEPASMRTGSTINYASSVLLLLLIAGALYMSFKNGASVSEAST